jgi:ElaB/YqjD/DUF883 family membrane-anchored ribosome-binding protein
MELYFKDLISEEGSVEKLVDDLALLVRGADDFVQTVGSQLSEESRREVAGRLASMKATCARLRNQAIAGAQATDKWLRKYPYSSFGLVFLAGVVMGAALVGRRQR